MDSVSEGEAGIRSKRNTVDTPGTTGYREYRTAMRTPSSPTLNSGSWMPMTVVVLVLSVMTCAALAPAMLPQGEASSGCCSVWRTPPIPQPHLTGLMVAASIWVILVVVVSASWAISAQQISIASPSSLLALPLRR